MDNWQQCILEANYYFVTNQYEAAHTLYRAADADHGVSALVISYLNSADLCQRQGNTEGAKETYSALIFHKTTSRQSQILSPKLT